MLKNCLCRFDRQSRHCERGIRGPKGRHTATAHDIEVFVVPCTLIRIYNGILTIGPHAMSPHDVASAPERVTLAFVYDIVGFCIIVPRVVFDAVGPENLI